MEENQRKLRAFIQEKFEIDDDPDFMMMYDLFNEGFVDSFGAVEIIHFIEQIQHRNHTKGYKHFIRMSLISYCVQA